MSQIKFVYTPSEFTEDEVQRYYGGEVHTIYLNPETDNLEIAYPWIWDENSRIHVYNGNVGNLNKATMGMAFEYLGNTYDDQIESNRRFVEGERPVFLISHPIDLKPDNFTRSVVITDYQCINVPNVDLRNLIQNNQDVKDRKPR